MSSTPNTSSQSRGYMIAIVGTVLWSTTAIFIRALTERDMPPLVIGFWRDALVAVAMLIALGLIRPALLKLPRQHWPFFLLYGLVLMLFNATWTISVALNGAAISTVLVYSSPALTAVIAWSLWRESLGWFKIAAVVLSLVGCVLVSGAYSLDLWRLNPLGIGIGLVSGLMFAFYSIAGKETSQRGINSWTALMVVFGIAAALFVIPLTLGLENWSPALDNVGRINDLLWLGSDWQGWVMLIVLAWGPTIAGYGLYTFSLNYLPSSVANLIVSIEPGLTALLAFLLLGEALTPLQLAGTVMIVSGVVLLRMESMTWKRKAPQLPAA